MGKAKVFARNKQGHIQTWLLIEKFLRLKNVLNFFTRLV